MNTLHIDKNKIFSIIAHDLRSPFNTILGCSELLLDSIEGKDTEEAYKYSKIVHSTAQNSLVLLDNLLNWSKLQTLQSNFNTQKIILSAVINEIMELFSSAATIKKIELVHHGSDDIEIYTDIDILKTVLRNMVSNAIKFTKVGGKVSIMAKKEQCNVEITISDNGIGISERNMDKLFSIETNKWTFGTSDEKGSGLGLPLCKEFIEKLGGSIYVKSIEGEGSEFKLTLPINYGIGNCNKG
jgi:signal transduction histidine kinase